MIMSVDDIKLRKEGEQMKKRGALLVESYEKVKEKEIDMKKSRTCKVANTTMVELNERTIIGLKHLYLYLA